MEQPGQAESKDTLRQLAGAGDGADRGAESLRDREERVTDAGIWRDLAEGRVSEEALQRLVPLIVNEVAEPPEWFILRAKRIPLQAAACRHGPLGILPSKFTVLHPARERFAAALTFDSAMGLRPVAVRRAGTKGRLLVYRTEELTAYLEVRWGGTGDATITGQILSEGPPSCVELWDEDSGARLATADTNDLGFFALAPIHPRPSLVLTVAGSAFPLFVCGSVVVPTE